MGSVTLRPNGTALAGSYTAQGAATLHAATSDNAASTARLPAFTTSSAAVYQSGTMMRLALGTFVLPARAQVRTVTPSAVAYRGSGQRTARLGVHYPSIEGAPTQSDSHVIGTAATTYTSPSYAPPKELNQYDIDNLQFVVSAQASFIGLPGTYGTLAQLDVQEAYLDVVYNEAPTTTVTAPVGTLTADARPTVRTDYADVDGDAQERMRVRVFTPAQYGALAFVPESSPALWESGELFTSETSVRIGVSLPNGTYRAYVSHADAGSGGRYGAWAYSEFTVAVDQPAQPLVTVAPDGGAARVAVTVMGRDNWLSANEASIETDTSGWAANGNVAAGYPQRSTAQAAHGAASLLVRSGAAGNTSVRTATGSAARPIPAGKRVTARASFRAAATPRDCRVELRFWRADGTPASSQPAISGTPVPDTTTGWTEAIVTAFAPWDAAFAGVVALVFNTAAGEDHYIDKIALAAEAPPEWTRGGLVALQRLAVDRSDDGGLTWAECASVADAAGNVLGCPFDMDDVSQEATVYDYEAPSRAPLRYRARSTAVDGENSLVSPASTAVATTVVNDGWWLKDPLDPTRNMQVRVARPSFRRREPQAVEDVLGSALPAVSSDGVKGAEGTLRLRTLSAAERAALWLLTGSGRTLLLQTVWGDNWYVRLGQDQQWEPVRAHDDGVDGYPVRDFFEVDLSFVEVP